MTDQADVTRWARTVAKAYAEACQPRLPALDEAHLAGELETPLTECLMLAIPATEWSQSHINPTLERWERSQRLGTGPRVRGVDYGRGQVAMG